MLSLLLYFALKFMTLRFSLLFFFASELGSALFAYVIKTRVRSKNG